MPDLRPVKIRDKTPVVYPDWRWRLLDSLREKALLLLQALDEIEEKPLVVGSVARGDVNSSSDIDIFFKGYVPSWRIALALEKVGVAVQAYRIVQATSQTALRFIAVVEDKVEISVPMSRLRRTEEEFPNYAGAITIHHIINKLRVRGINKQLLFIEPTCYGHDEWSIIGREEESAKLLGISIETILERKSMREKRAREGRTGFLFNIEISGEESPEEFVCSLARKNPILRETIRTTINCI